MHARRKPSVLAVNLIDLHFMKKIKRQQRG